MKHRMVLLGCCTFILGAAACSSNQAGVDDDNGSRKVSDETSDIVETVDEVEGTESDPITITIAYPWGEDQFNERFNPIDEKFLELDIEYAYFNGSSEGLQELFAADIIPDIIVSSPSNVAPLEELDAIYPLDDLVIQEDVDVKRLNPALVSLVKGLDSQQRLIGFPDGTGLFALYYNKEVFDLFGVPYPDPDEPMTWKKRSTSPDR